uniref:Secreted protein n=1 Tax=Mandrillus leucophaeus TaxID=9568 RepID=A0A2K5XKM1_MANLE
MQIWFFQCATVFLPLLHAELDSTLGMRNKTFLKRQWTFKGCTSFSGSSISSGMFSIKGEENVCDL